MSLFNNSPVVQLTPKNLYNSKTIVHPRLDGYTKSFVFFEANWCGFCKRAAPEYIKAAMQLGESMPLFSVDCVEYPTLATKCGVKSYPTIKYVSANGKMNKLYEGERSKDGFVSKICENCS